MKYKWLRKGMSVLLVVCLLAAAVPGSAGAIGSDVDIDVIEGADVSIGKEAIFVNAEGTVLDSSDEYSKVTLTGSLETGNRVTAVCDFDDESGCYTFLGWYDGETCLGEEPTLTFTVGGQQRIIPRILSNNVLSHASSFESLTNNGTSLYVPVKDSTEYFTLKDGVYKAFPSGDAPTGYLWGSFSNFSYPTYVKQGEEYVALTEKNGAYCGDNYFSIRAYSTPYSLTYFTNWVANGSSENTTAETTVMPHSGSSMVATNNYSRSSIHELTGLKKNTDYVLSVWVYSQTKYAAFTWGAVASNYTGLATLKNDSYSDDCEVLGSTGISPKYGEWNQVKISFNSGDNTTAYLHLGLTGNLYSGTEGMNFIDDLTVFEADSYMISAKQMIADGYVTTQGDASLKGTAINLDYTASGISFTADCEGKVVLKLSTEIFRDEWSMKLKKTIDGMPAEDVIIPDAGGTEIVLAENLVKGKHTFKIERATEYNIGRVYISGVSLNGSMIAPPAQKELYYEFYGDSITAGYGTTYFSGDPDWPLYEDGTKTYAYLTAQNMKANLSVFAFSGIGVAVGGGNNGEGETMAQKLDSLPYRSDADAVIINLGTNDASKYAAAGLTKQQVTDTYIAFIQNIRNTHPDSIIVMAHGMMTAAADSFVADAVAAVKADGEENLYTVALPLGRSGGDSHPNEAEHAAAAEVLTAFLRGLGSTLAGDIDMSSDVDLQDVVRLAQHIAEWDVEVNSAVTDVDGNGKLELLDLVNLAQYVAEWSNIQMTGDLYARYYNENFDLKNLSENLKLNGRAAFLNDGLQLEWSYSGFEIAGQLQGDITLTGITSTAEILCYSVIDGDYDNAKQLRIKDGNLTVAENLLGGYHTVQFIKATEASRGRMNIKGITYQGALFKRPADKALKIEFIGDSITSAGGLYKTDVQPDALLRQNTFLGYAPAVARAFDADCSIVSISGGSICTKNSKLPDYYTRTFYSKADTAWDFSAEDEPDIVVIALGTNDTPSYTAANIDVLKAGITDLLTLVREKNPNATIIWAYGMMATNLASDYKAAVEAFAASDGNTYYTLINRNHCDGDNGHPTPEGHKKNAEELISFIKANGIAG